MSEINNADENHEYQGDEFSCECGSLSGSIHDGLVCNMCDTICSGGNMVARVTSNVGRNLNQTTDTKETSPIVNVTIEQQKSSAATSIVFALGSVIVCGSILLSAWFLKR